MDIKILNLPTKEIYKDLFQPGMRKVGQALETVLDVSNIILLPLKLINEKSKIYFDNNIKRYSEKLNSKEEPVDQVPEYLGLPILDKLTYLQENELSEAFINLLTKASYAKTFNLVHPSFINILNNLSVDEAKILLYYKNHTRIPFIDIYIYSKLSSINTKNKKIKSREELKESISKLFEPSENAYIKWAWNLTLIQKEVDLIFPENIDIYIENLSRNGLIEFERKVYHKSDLKFYQEIIQDNQSIYDSLQKQLPEIENEELKCEVQTKKGVIEFTEMGKKFIEACIKE